MSDPRTPAWTVQVPAALATNIAAAKQTLDALSALADQVEAAAVLMRDALLGGHKILCCGNGGSAADSAHLTAEIAGRYKIDRGGFPAIDLTANHSLLTSLINDFPPEQVFARQVDALGDAGDVLIVLSTSGQSENIRRALEAARARSVGTVAMLGRDGGSCRGLADVELLVPGTLTARIQEAHLLLYHTLCELLDPVLAGGAR